MQSRPGDRPVPGPLPLALLALTALLLAAVASPAPASPAPGQPAPDFALPDLNGNRVRLSEHRGKVVLLNFWACWCDTWKDEVQRLRQLRMQQPDLEYEVLFVSVDARDRSLAEPLLKREGVFFPVLIDPSSSVSQAYQITTVPTLFVLDARGVVRYVHQGYPGNRVLARELADCRSSRPGSGLSSEALAQYLLPAERELLSSVNRERVNRGLAPLALDPALTEVGREYLQRMLESGQRGHYGPESPDRRLKARGVGFRKMGENLAEAAGPEQALQSMLSSPGHKANLLSPAFERVGVSALRAGSGYLFCVLLVQP